MADGANDAFGALLKRQRLAAGLTQEQVAERAGISARAVSDLERGGGRRPRLQTVGLLAAGLGLRPDQRARLLAAARPDAPGTPVAPPSRLPDLPAPTTPLIGRELLVAHVAALFRAPDVRLVCLTGPGGVGKTRVALALADELRNAFADGLAFVPLAALSDAQLLLPTIAGVVGIRVGAGESVTDGLRAALRDRRMLLILDNCERLLRATPHLADLLAACPDLKVLATSRAALRLRGEHEVAVLPLGLPDPRHTEDLHAVEASAAVRLFVDRSRAIQPDFTLTAQNAPSIVSICRRLDGLPLAIELGAARMRLLTPQALLERLAPSLRLSMGGARDLPARQRTLWDTIAWSHGLLDAPERRLFRRLAVFAGSWTLQAAEWICDPDERLGLDVLDGLESLAAQSLVRREGTLDSAPRFAMLETIHDFAAEQLAECGELDVYQARHASWCLALAEEGAPHLQGPEQASWLARLDAEHDNLQAALTWARARREGEMQARFVAALCWFWGLRTHYAEGSLWAQAALSAELTPQARADALFAAGLFWWYQGELQRAHASGQDCLALRRGLGDQRGEAQALILLGQTATDSADLGQARTWLERALAIGRELGDSFIVASSLYRLGWQAEQARDYERAYALNAESVERAETAGNWALGSMALVQLGRVAMEQGDGETAQACLTRGLARSAPTGDPLRTALLLASLGELARRRGQDGQARTHLESALAILRDVRDRRTTERALDSLARLSLKIGDVDAARRHAEEALALEPDMDATFPALRQIPHGPDWEAWVVAHVLAGATAEALARDVLDLAREWQPDIVVRDGVEFGGCLAAEVRGIPHAVGGFCPFGPPGMYRDVFAPPLARLRDALGLPPDPEFRMPHRYLGLVATVPGLLNGQEVPPTVHLLRPLPFDRSGHERLPDWVLHLPEQPTVYATLGTIVNRSPGIFAAILEGLRDESITLVLTIGRNQDPAEFGPQPSNVHIERYVPQTLLLPYCDLVVTHGGFNTVQASLGGGLPMVILPIAADQHLNAQSCTNLGVARVVGPEERTPHAIRAAVRDMLATRTYRARAERVQADMAALPGADYAIELLERLAAEKQPLVGIAPGT